MTLPKIAFVALIFSTILWNAWVFGWLNNGLAGYLRMSISELNVIGQPFYNFFTLTEYLSGLLLIVSALCLWLVQYKTFILTLIALSVALMGILTVYDAANPLDCNQYQNPTCAARNNKSTSDNHHNAESKVTAYVSAFLSVFVAVWLYIVRSNRSLFIASVVIFLIVLITLEILNTSSSIMVNAVAQRTWNVAISGDFFIIGYIVSLNKKVTNYATFP